MTSGELPQESWRSRFDAPDAVRRCVRAGTWSGPTGGLAPGFAQANLILLPATFAEEFVDFCRLNPAACPVLEVLTHGAWVPRLSAPSADLRFDLPAYRVYRHGVLVEERQEIASIWEADLVAVLLGCSFTVDRALRAAGVPLRHVEQGTADPTYVTRIACQDTAMFSTHLLVSMRPVPRGCMRIATEVSARYVGAHGPPLRTTSASLLGIRDLRAPDFGDPPAMEADDVTLFWPCALTGLSALLAAQIPLVISHKPGHMFITDLLDEALADPSAWPVIEPPRVDGDERILGAGGASGAV